MKHFIWITLKTQKAYISLQPFGINKLSNLLFKIARTNDRKSCIRPRCNNLFKYIQQPLRVFRKC